MKQLRSSNLRKTCFNKAWWRLSTDMSRLVYPDASVILAGDLNMLSDQEITETTGLLPLVHQSIRGNSCLERLYALRNFFTTVRVVTSSVRSDHRTIIATSTDFVIPRPTHKRKLPVSSQEDVALNNMLSFFVSCQRQISQVSRIICMLRLPSTTWQNTISTPSITAASFQWLQPTILPSTYHKETSPMQEPSHAGWSPRGSLIVHSTSGCSNRMPEREPTQRHRPYRRSFWIVTSTVTSIVTEGLLHSSFRSCAWCWYYCWRI